MLADWRVGEDFERRREALCLCASVLAPLPTLPPPCDQTRMGMSTPVEFEPTRGDPIGLAGRRLSHSAKVSYAPEDPLPPAQFAWHDKQCRPRQTPTPMLTPTPTPTDANLSMWGRIREPGMPPPNPRRLASCILPVSMPSSLPCSVRSAQVRQIARTPSDIGFMAKLARRSPTSGALKNARVSSSAQRRAGARTPTSPRRPAAQREE